MGAVILTGASNVICGAARHLKPNLLKFGQMVPPLYMGRHGVDLSFFPCFVC